VPQLAPVAAILGSAFRAPSLGGQPLEPHEVATRFGPATLHRLAGGARDAWVVFRHGLPHRWLPQQIPYRAQAAALAEVGVRALLTTSSVGVLDPSLPLDVPLLLSDLIMVDNRLPDGSACTLWPEPLPGQAHLVLDEGLFSRALTGQVEALLAAQGHTTAARAVFAYQMGPRTKTAAENAFWAAAGAQVNSMTLAPEVVLANELEIPVAGLVVGHKYSRPGVHDRLDRPGIDAALAEGERWIAAIVSDFLRAAEPVPWGNRLYRY